MVAPGDLQPLESRISILPPSATDLRAGRMVTFKLVGADNLTVLGLLETPFSLSWITKGVQWRTDQPIAMPVDASLAPEILDGTPPRVPTISQAALPLGTEELPGLGGGATPRDSPLGTFSQISGTTSVPVQLPVGVEVCWSVLKNGAPTAECCAGSAIRSPDFSVAFIPPTSELRSDAPLPIETYEVQASVVLSVGDPVAGLVQHGFTLSVPVYVPHVGIPIVVGLFRHVDFAATWAGKHDGFVLLMVPANSPLASVGQARAVLDTIRGTLADLATVASVSYGTSLLLLDLFRSAIADQPDAELVTGAGFRLNALEIAGVAPEDRGSSMIMLGPPGHAIECYNKRSYHWGEGMFYLSPGERRPQAGTTYGPEVITVIRSLHSSGPVSEPTGQEIAVREAQQEFGDELSSIRFSPAPKNPVIVAATPNALLPSCQPSARTLGVLMASERFERAWSSRAAREEK